jgi:hypothetical protein
MVGGQKTIFHLVPNTYQNMVVLDQFLLLLCGPLLVFLKDSIGDHTGYQYQYLKILGVK